MDFKKVTELLDRIALTGLNECGLAVSLDGKKVYEHYSGYSDAGKTKPLCGGELYWIYSATKVITCVAALRLLEEGKISLSDPVSKYIPEFSSPVIRDAKTGEIRPAENTMTIEHLFTMTGGMSYDLNSAPIKEAAAVPGAGTLDVVRAMGRVPLLFEPGTRYKYSLCHDVLAAVVEIVSGERFGEYVKKNIFDPLGMSSTGIRITEEQKARMCDQFRFRLADGTSRLVEKENHFFITPDYESGGAAVFSSVEDYLKLVSVLSVGGTAGGYRLLRPETIALCEANRLCPDALADFVTGRLYGYGWGLCGRVHINAGYSLSLSSEGEFGWDGAAGAFCLVDRRNRVGYYFGTHALGCTYLYHWVHPTLRNLIYEALD